MSILDRKYQGEWIKPEGEGAPAIVERNEIILIVCAFLLGVFCAFLFVDMTDWLLGLGG